MSKVQPTSRKFHKWTEPRYVRLRFDDRMRYELYQQSWFYKNPSKHCVKCGAMLKTRVWDGRPKPHLYLPFCGTWGHTKKLPPCEGLPKDYDPPMGA